MNPYVMRMVLPKFLEERAARDSEFGYWILRCYVELRLVLQDSMLQVLALAVAVALRISFSVEGGILRAA